MAEYESDLRRYLTHDEMTGLLHRWAGAYPRLASLESLGRSPEGRDLWLMAITDKDAGAAADKPAIYIDGNIHAGEVFASVVCLTTIWDLLSRFGEDPEVTNLLQVRTFYVRPRVSPDGAERYLTTPDRPRSAPRPWPRNGRAPGLHPSDLDGDGHITMMRQPHPAGAWRLSDLDPRLMVRRGLDEPAGGGYQLWPEGTVEGPPGEVQPARPLWGLDFNRSFPHAWLPEHEQAGAGPYPLFPPETRATADFLLSHPNIGAVVAYHTHGGFVYHLPSSASPAQYGHDDLSGPYRELTEAYTRLTGEPPIQSYDEAAGRGRHGSFMDWAYNQHGVYGWVPELWDVWRAAGIEREPGSVAPPTEDEEAALLRWSDETLAGAGFVDWRPFDHPQLGPVEIGGWTHKFTHQNPPPRYIPEAGRPHRDWTYLVARALPQLAIEQTHLRPLAGEFWSLSVRVLNEGFLPTNLSEQAILVGQAEPVMVAVEGDGIEIVAGDNPAAVGHLAGYGQAKDAAWGEPDASRRRATARFAMRVPAGTERIRVRAWSPKAGAVSRIIDLGEAVDGDGERP